MGMLLVRVLFYLNVYTITTKSYNKPHLLTNLLLLYQDL